MSDERRQLPKTMGERAAAEHPDLDALAEGIREAHAAVREGLRSALAAAVRAGEKLAEAKRRVGHGGWGDWVAENLDFSQQTAAFYMRMALRRDEIETAVSISDARRLLADRPLDDDPLDWRKHWVGMPEFEQEDLKPVKTVHVHFARAEDVEEFARRIGREIKTDARGSSLWYPEQPPPQRVADLRWIDVSGNGDGIEEEYPVPEHTDEILNYMTGEVDP